MSSTPPPPEYPPPEPDFRQVAAPVDQPPFAAEPHPEAVRSLPVVSAEMLLAAPRLKKPLSPPPRANRPAKAAQPPLQNQPPPRAYMFRKLSAVTVLEQSISSTLDSCNDDVYLYGFVCELQFHAVDALRAQLKLVGFIAPASWCVST